MGEIARTKFVYDGEQSTARAQIHGELIGPAKIMALRYINKLVSVAFIQCPLLPSRACYRHGGVCQANVCL